MQKLTTFLMFAGQAEEAMNFYLSLFENSKVLSIIRYGPGDAGAEGSVMLATFTLNGQEFMCIDSNIEHGFTFTPAMSIYVKCESEAEIDRLFSTNPWWSGLDAPGSLPIQRKIRLACG